MKTKEIFAEIKDFPNYFVSNFGIVYSGFGKKLKPLALVDNGNGYYKVNLCKDSKMFPKYIHRLVAEAFIPNPDNLSTVNHLDEDKHNNSVDNLAWTTREDNIRYSLCKPVIDLTTGAIYPSAIDASRTLQVHHTTVTTSLKTNNGRYKGHRFMFLPKATEESENVMEFFGKKYEVPEIYDEYNFVRLFDF